MPAAAIVTPSGVGSAAVEGRSLLSRFRLADGKHFFSHEVAVERLKRSVGRFRGSHGNKGERAVLTGFPVQRDLYIKDQTMCPKEALKLFLARCLREISDKQFIIHYVMFCLDGPLASRVFPTIGFRIITELSSPEDLPHLESNELSNDSAPSVFRRYFASF